MKAFLPLSVFCCTLFSCSRYQYATIESSTMNKNDKLEFVTENDTLRLQYNFNGVNAPINITVQNKLNVPVSVDWQRSALIVNGKAISYVPATVKIEGAYGGSSYNFASTHLSSNNGSLVATAEVPQQLAFIPPQTYITKNPMGVTNRFISDVPDSAYHKAKFYMTGDIAVRVKKATFTEATSPLRFKSYLTVMIGDQPAKPVVYEHSFYVAELITTGQRPENVWFPSIYRGNQYYIKETTGFGQAATGFGVIAGTAVLSAVGESLSNSGNNTGAAGRK